MQTRSTKLTSLSKASQAITTKSLPALAETTDNSLLLTSAATTARYYRHKARCPSTKDTKEQAKARTTRLISIITTPCP